MTEDELIEIGYTPMNCKIGTLYFKDDFVCRLSKDGVVDFRMKSDDMVTRAKVTTIKEVQAEEKRAYVAQRQRLSILMARLDNIIESYD